MAFAFAGAGTLDYFPCHYGTSRLVFRGPQRDLRLPYVVALGGTETYGKFVPRPWPELLEAAAGWRMVNLGQPNAGPDVWLSDPGVMRVIGGAQQAVVQVTAATNLSNRFYSVHPRRNDRFLRAQAALVSLYPEVDFTHFNFTRHLLSTLRQVSPQRFQTLVRELQLTWVARMRQLIAQAGVPVTLLWMAEAPPPVPGAEGPAEPALVDGAMLAALVPPAGACVEVVFTAAARAAGHQGMAFAEMDRPAALGLPGPVCHQEVAEALAAVLDG